MSKLKPSEVEKDTEIVQANIRSRCAHFKCTTEEKIAKKIGITPSTYHNRKIKGDWSLPELSRAAKALKVTLTWLTIDHSKVEEVKS